MPGNGYRKKKSLMKPWKKQMLQGTIAIDEHPRKYLPVSHSKPDCHSKFYVKLINSPMVVISWSRTKRAKCEMQSCLPKHALEERVGQFQMRKRRKRRDGGQGLLQTYIEISLICITEKNWAITWINHQKFHDIRNFSLHYHQAPTPVALH